MQVENRLRYYVTGLYGLSFLLPITLMTVYCASLLAEEERWSFLSLGFLCGTSGSLALLLILRRWELQFTPVDLPNADELPLPVVEPPETVDYSPYTEEIERLREAAAIHQGVHEDLTKELQHYQGAYQRGLAERDELQQRNEQLQQTVTAQHERAADQLRAKESQQHELQQTLAEQQALLDKRQKQITTLENSVRDLKYELKTLIDLTDRIHMAHGEEEAEPVAIQVPVVTAATPTPRPARVDTTPMQPLEPQTQLKRCVDMAQKLTGARHLAGHTPRFQDLSVDGYALDFRRLCDSLRSENGNMILLFSQRENRLLFVNNQVKELTGWTADQFVQNFATLVTEGAAELQQTLRLMTPTQLRTELAISIKTKSGELHPLQCHLGLIPTGIFKMHVIGVITRAAAVAID